ncbi:MAG: hypothetical protein A3F72_06010 [Bacteroidetes bacterium RIFCSPLOWO2_12_FULL_35_15]|nr:MAG: hypothetical protein A3F72_06010 [Bacteroidetes bacterium RIFCSPLOWO2_12_FULL_35_15]
MKTLILDNDRITFELEDGILIGVGKCTFIDLDLSVKITNDRLEIQKGKIYPLLSNIKSLKNTTKEARDFMASEKGCEGVIAAAVLINSSVGSMIGNFFIFINKPLVPTKLFTNEEEAKKWLKSFN